MGDLIPITRTKIVIPRRRSELISRPRLTSLLDGLLDNRLIILSAPAGYGKTSLLVDFSQTTQWPMCWYSLDNLDRDLQRFIAYFISAIRLRYSEFGQSSLTALYGMSQDNLDVHAMVTMIVNEIYEKITEHFILVLDDFHLVSASREVIHFVNQFLMSVDENCHLILVSRALLTLPDLTLMVARSQVGGLSYQELSFLPEEIQKLLTQNDQLHLSEIEIQEIARETEGWITGLLLSSQIMGKTMANQIRIARVSGVGLYEYLAQQVLAQQSQEIQDFLLWTALLDEFDENLCEDVIGAALKVEQPWPQLIDIVLKNNLFVLPVGDDGSVFRYHHLFRDFLQDRIRRERPEEAKKIANRLAEIYIVQQDWDHAFEIYRSLNDQAAMVQLILQAASHLIADGRFLTLSQWIEAVPPEDLTGYSGLVSLLGTITVRKGDTAQGIHLLDQAVESLAQAGQIKETAQTLLRRGTAYRMAGQFDLALADVEKVFELYGPDPQIDVNYTDALFSQAILFVYLGKLKEALTLLHRAKDGYLLLQDPNTAAKAWMEIGRVSRLLGYYADAEAAYQRSLEYFESTHNLVWQANLYNNLGVLLHSKGDYVEAVTDFEKAVIYARATGSPRLEGYTLASIGDLYLELDADQEAEVAFRQAQEIAQKIHDDYLIGYVNLALGKLWIHQSAPDQARIPIMAAQEQFTNRSSLTEQNLVEIENGRLYMMAGQYTEACDCFHQALDFFLHESFEREVLRIRILLFVSALLMGNEDEATRQKLILQSNFNEPKKSQSFLLGCQDARVFLEKDEIKNSQDPFILNIFAAMEAHEKEIHQIRRAIRRHAAVIPFAPPKMVIRALGRISVRIANHSITSSDWQVQTARDLFFLLLSHPEGLTKEQIGEIFWPDSSISELKLRFKNTIYRLRHAAGKNSIPFEGEKYYSFNREMDYEYDVETFQKEIQLSEKAQTPEQRKPHLLNAIKQYRGIFLPNVDGTWVLAERERLSQQYIGCLLKLAMLYFETKDYPSSLETCQEILKEDPCQESAHRIAMQVYAAIGNRALVIRQYEMCCEALLNEVDAQPSYQTKALYDRLIL